MATATISSIQSGSVTFGTSDYSKSVTISAVTVSTCIIYINGGTSDGSGSNESRRDSVTAYLTNSTTLLFNKALSETNLVINYTVVAYSAGVTIQNYLSSAGMDYIGNTTVNVTVSAVTIAKTYVQLYFTGDLGSSEGHYNINTVLTSTTNLRLTTSPSYWYGQLAIQLITFDDASVQTLTGTMTGLTQAISMSSVDITKSFLIGNYWTPENTLSGYDYLVWLLSNSTTITMQRQDNYTGTNATYTFYVTTISYMSVQRAVFTINSGTSSTSSITSVDTTKSWIQSGMTNNQLVSTNVSSSPLPSLDRIKYELTNATTLTFTRLGTAADNVQVPWEVVSFGGGAAASIVRQAAYYMKIRSI